LASASLDPLSRQAQTRVRLEPIEERIIPIQRQRLPQPHQLQQPETTTTDIRRHYAVYRRRASNVEPSLSYLSSPFSSSAAVVVDSDNPAAGGGFCVSVGRHSRGFSVSLRPKQQQQQQQLVSVVMPTAGDSSPRQRSPSNDQQPSRYTIYQPLLATGRTSSTAQQLYDLPHRHLLLPLSPSHPAGIQLLSNAFSRHIPYAGGEIAQNGKSPGKFLNVVDSSAFIRDIVIILYNAA